MTTHLVTRLTQVLAAEERVHRSLRQVLAEERERMLDLDAESLYELAMRKEVLAEEGRLARDARAQASEDLAIALGLPAKNVTLSELCTALGDGAEPLYEAQSRLLAIVRAVFELSEANRTLGGDRLADVQATLQLLGKLVPASVLEPGQRGGTLVRRSA